MIRWSPSQPMRTGCPHGRLSRLLSKALPEYLSIAASSLRPWASANFIGARHRYTLSVRDRVDGMALSAMAHSLQDRLAQEEWPLFQHIVADLSVEPLGDQQAMMLEILTVEE